MMSPEQMKEELQEVDQFIEKWLHVKDDPEWSKEFDAVIHVLNTHYLADVEAAKKYRKVAEKQRERMDMKKALVKLKSQMWKIHVQMNMLIVDQLKDHAHG